MKQLFTLAIIAVLCSCNNKAGLTEKIMALKDSCAVIDMQMDTLTAGNKARLNAVFHSSDTTGIEKLIADADAMLDTANQSAYMKIHAEYLTKKDSLEAVKKSYLRQIDSLELKLQE